MASIFCKTCTRTATPVDGMCPSCGEALSKHRPNRQEMGNLVADPSPPLKQPVTPDQKRIDNTLRINKKAKEERASWIILGFLVIGMAVVTARNGSRTHTSAPVDYAAAARSAEEDRRAQNIASAALTIEGMVISRLRDPASYVRDQIMPMESPTKGVIGVVITFRSKNGFGGYTAGYASGNCNMEAKNCKILQMGQD